MKPRPSARRCAQGGGPARFARLGQAAEDYAQAVQAGDPALIVMADGAFHRELCRASGNAPLLALWQSLSRQLAVVWGLGRQGRDPAPAVREHTALVQALLAGDRHGAADALSDHVNWHQHFDFEAVLLERRGARRWPESRSRRGAVADGAPRRLAPLTFARSRAPAWTNPVRRVRDRHRQRALCRTPPCAGRVLAGVALSPDAAVQRHPPQDIVMPTRDAPAAFAPQHRTQHWHLRKPAARGRAGMVVSQVGAAAEAGVAMLDAGGSAADAAVATAFALAAVEPWNSGLGGIGFAQVMAPERPGRDLRLRPGRARRRSIPARFRSPGG